jgi:glutathione synthase/RimK-type ligase-like ATP-grasp enzyme
MRKIVIATCSRWPDLSASDRLYAEALTARGCAVAAAPWNRLPEPFHAADAVVLRSTWDYHYELGRFTAWLDDLERRGVPVYNPPDLVRWNLAKSYLLDLGARGVPVPSTHIVRRDPAAVAAAFALTGWDRAVVKPAAGASGHNVRLVERREIDAVLSGLQPDGDADRLVVQEFLPEIRETGELACVFFDGQFSHAFWRRPAPGEFRVNSQYGAWLEPTSPAEATVGRARAVLDALPVTPLYARVDGLPRADAFLLMELELIEPGLALELAEGAADRFAEATIRRLL